MKKVALPPGCAGLDMADGTKYSAGRDGRVQVGERHADAIRRGWYGASGVMVVDEPHHLGTKGTRWCHRCAPGGRAWNAWTTTCPRCGAPTTEEQP